MIPLIKPLMPPIELLSEYLQEPYETGTWSNFGPLYFAAVHKIAALTGRFPVLVNSATAGLDLSLGTHSAVAVPDYTHAGTMVALMNNGCQPIIVSCDPRTMAMNEDDFEDLCKSGEITGAIIVNPFGYGIDRKFFADVAREYDVSVVFDYAGAWGDFDYDDEFPTVYSFHATKSLPIGEGGVILYANEQESLLARRRSNFSTGPSRMIEDAHGQNFKISELTAAMLCAQLDERQYPAILNRIQHRRRLYETYAAGLMRERLLLPEIKSPSLCVFSFPEIKPHDFEAMAANFGFVAKQYYIPLRSMPGYWDFEIEGRFCPELDRCIALPSDCTMEEAQHVVESVLRFLPE